MEILLYIYSAIFIICILGFFIWLLWRWFEEESETWYSERSKEKLKSILYYNKKSKFVILYNNKESGYDFKSKTRSIHQNEIWKDSLYS